jgi:hypothetical protein
MGLGLSARRTRWIQPVASPMIENDVEDDSESEFVGSVYQVEKVLDAVAMVGVEMTPLLEHWVEPDGGHPQLFQVRQLGHDAGDGATLPTLSAGLGPAVPPPRLFRALRRPGGCQVRPIQERTIAFLAVAEAIDEKKVRRSRLATRLERRSTVAFAEAKRPGTGYPAWRARASALDG